MSSGPSSQYVVVITMNKIICPSQVEERERFNICSMAIKYTILSIRTQVEEETSDGLKQTNFSVPQYLCV